MNTQFIRQLSLVMTERCNFSCPYCYQSTHSGPVMAKGVIEAVIYALKNQAQVPQVHFFGGEPLLAFEEIRFAVSALQAIGIREFSITTNGSLITLEKAKFLRDNNFTVIVSMDGGAQAQALRQPSSFKSLKRKISVLFNAFHDRPAHISTHAVVTADNIFFLCNSVAQLAELGFRRVAISPVFDEQHAWPDKSLCAIDKEFGKLAVYCNEHYREHGWVPLNKWDGTGESKDIGCGCALVNGKSFSVHVNGDLSTCLAVLSSRMPEKLKDAFKVGTIFEGFPSADDAAKQCQRTLDRQTDKLSVVEQQRGRMSDTYGCPLSVLLATDRSQLTHQEIWKSAERRLIEQLPKRRKVFAKAGAEGQFRFAWSKESDS